MLHHEAEIDADCDRHHQDRESHYSKSDVQTEQKEAMENGNSRSEYNSAHPKGKSNISIVRQLHTLYINHGHASFNTLKNT